MLTSEARSVSKALGLPCTPRYWSPIFDNNPHLVKSGGYPLPNKIGNRPYHIGAVKIEGHGTKVLFSPHFKVVPGDLYTDKTIEKFAKGKILLEPNVKPDFFGPNKDWGWDKYQEVANHFGNCVQVGPPGTKTLKGVELLETPTFIDAVLTLSTADLFIGPEGGLGHGAAAVGTVPAVIIFGGLTPPAQMGYDFHTNLAADDAGCGHMFPCAHCRRAMDSISVEEVIEAAEQLLS